MRLSEYAKAAQQKSELERQTEKEKTGVFTGAYALNPVNSQKIPVWIADYVLEGYGTGAIMAVPAHDERDHEFAQKFELPIVTSGTKTTHRMMNVRTTNWRHDELGEYRWSGLGRSPGEHRAELAKQGNGDEKVNYKMRDWTVSRQRYWGAPIPIINCEKCGAVLVPEDDLPVVLPELDDFKPSGDGRSALARANDWLKVDCPKCGGPAERETDTLDTYI